MTNSEIKPLINNVDFIHEMAKLLGSKYVNKVILEDNHRHEALNEVLDLLANN